jgi:hypothetical protein
MSHGRLLANEEVRTVASRRAAGQGRGSDVDRQLRGWKNAVATRRCFSKSGEEVAIVRVIPRDDDE